MNADGPRWRIEEISGHHDRASFSCGHPSLDEYLKRYAGQNQKSGVSRTFVALGPGEASVRGYYSLAAGSVRIDDLTEAQRKKLPRYPVPVAHLGRLAVDRGSQGQRLGEFLLLDALARVTSVDQSIGIHAVEVVAIDEAAAKFYARYGFVQMRENSQRLFMSLSTVRKLLLS